MSSRVHYKIIQKILDIPNCIRNIFIRKKNHRIIIPFITFAFDLPHDNLIFSTIFVLIHLICSVSFVLLFVVILSFNLCFRRLYTHIFLSLLSPVSQSLFFAATYTIFHPKLIEIFLLFRFAKMSHFHNESNEHTYMKYIGILPCWCLGSNGRIPWRTFGQDYVLDAIMDPWLLGSSWVQENPRATYCTPNCPTQLAQIHAIAHLAMVEIVAKGQAFAQCYTRWRWNRCKYTYT